ncbi:uracil-DNA glycosylase [Actinorhabdospora filicis]|uniref:Type-4 uracil-DNA glycosylase n=1 Tax=Actinorhabdospora filicis TaxID=1785913 RepID=A0A9W6SSX5_9ACTN|nr:UdgX family uracil-DNA binding protein [Actinorhabdospora filicis]GLZ81901.1 uracil-DNA glycosylase [Actinorhabdospora filicis]
MSAEEYLPQQRDLAELTAAAAACRGCRLWADATRTVFGEGDPHASLMLIGEQPGDTEDHRGRPFTGPAGGVLDRALLAAGIEREAVWLTNAVKHFKFTVDEDGRRRHRKPDRPEILACLPWLRAEIAAVRPALVVAMGATAAQAVIGPSFRVTRRRGQLLDGRDGYRLMATVHPSSILRTPPADREAAFDLFVADLSAAAATLRPGA